MGYLKREPGRTARILLVGALVELRTLRRSLKRALAKADGAFGDGVQQTLDLVDRRIKRVDADLFPKKRGS